MAPDHQKSPGLEFSHYLRHDKALEIRRKISENQIAAEDEVKASLGQLPAHILHPEVDMLRKLRFQKKIRRIFEKGVCYHFAGEVSQAARSIAFGLGADDQLGIGCGGNDMQA